MVILNYQNFQYIQTAHSINWVQSVPIIEDALLGILFILPTMILETGMNFDATCSLKNDPT